MITLCAQSHWEAGWFKIVQLSEGLTHMIRTPVLLSPSKHTF